MAASTRSAVPAWSLRLVSELEASDARAELVARGLNRAQLSWSPAPGAWSVGQCLKHLLLTNEVYLSAISSSLEGQERSPVPEVILGGFGRWCIRNYIDPSSGGRRARASKKIQPAGNVDLSVLDGFLGSNRAAREMIRRAADYDVNRIRFKNPLIPLLRFTVGTGLEIVSKHQSRHLQQAERVRQSPEFQGITGSTTLDG